MTRTAWTNLCALRMFHRRPDIPIETLLILAEAMYVDAPDADPLRAGDDEILAMVRPKGVKGLK